MARQKNLHITSDTQIHMTTVYTRNGRGTKKNANRSYNFVVKGLLLSTALVGSVLLNGCGILGADTPTHAPKVENTAGVHSKYTDQSAIASNLKMATKVLDSAIKSGQITSPMYDNVMKRLVAVEAVLAKDGNFKDKDAILAVVDYSDKIVKAPVKTTDVELLAKRASSLQALQRVQDKLGVAQSARRVDGIVKSGVVVQMDGAKGGTTTQSGASGAKSPEELAKEAGELAKKSGGSAEVHNGGTGAVISNAPAGYQQPSTPSNYNPPKISQPSSSQTNKTQVQQKSAPTQSSPTVTQQATQPVSTSISAKYYGHTYGVDNQDEYNKVMQIASSAMAGYQNSPVFSNSNYVAYFDRYMNGERPDSFPSGSADNRGLSVVESKIGNLVSSGVSSSEIARVLKAQNSSVSRINIPDYGSFGGASAYDALVNGKVDCDSGAQAVSAMYETAGYRTKIIATNTHAEVIVSVGGSWWSPTGGEFSKVDLGNLGGYRVYVN